MKSNIIPHDYEWAKALSRRSRTDLIVIHHTASRPDITVEDIHQLHIDNDWAGIGYNLVIYPDGSVHQGRPLDTMGAQCEGYNNRSIGVNLTGNFEIANPTQEQVDAQRAGIGFIQRVQIRKKACFTEQAFHLILEFFG